MQTRRGLFVMAVSQWLFCAAVLLLLIQGLQCSPTPPTCPEPCLCQRGPLLNCSSAGLSQAPQHIPSTINDLDLSHNLLNSLAPSWPSWGLNNLWLGHNSITHLSLCVGRTWRGKHGRIPLSHNRGRCVSWAPALQLLSAERNQLEMIPEGLGGSEFLQVLQLSHNRISGLQPGDLCRCPHLRELRLQHNHISYLHPHAFRDLPQLRVLDLSFNLLTTIPPSAYLSLCNLNALVEVSGNRWRCDCNLRSVRRWMAHDRDRALQQTWRGVVCASPSAHAGRDLLHLEDSDLTCSTAENREGLHQDVTVTEGTEILLPCGPPQQDSTWWTTNGQVSGSQTGLLISDITEEDAGLYVCMSGPEEQYISVFNIHVHKTQRKSRGTRSLHWERKLINTEVGSLQGKGQGTDLNSLDLHRASQRTQSDLVLAVCLSVFITFLLAFILGALARPLLDPLWRRCCNRTKQSSSPAQSVSSAGQGPYDNDAYSDEAREELGTHRESRVTFRGHPSEIRDQNSIPYYDTVANGRQDNLAGEYDATYENVHERDTSHPSLEVHHPSGEKSRAQDSVSSQQDSPETDTHSGDLSDVSLSEPQVGAHPVHTHHGMEFEPIPDPEQLQGYQSSSVSSHSDQERPDRDQDMDWPKNNLAQRLEEKHKTQNNPWEKEDDSFEQSSDFPMVKQVDVPQIKISSVGEIPGFTAEPFTDWKPIKAEFPDSIQGASAQSSSQDLSGSAFDDQLSMKEHEQARNEEPLVKDQRENNKLLKLNLSDSGNEPTVYTVNPETEVVKEKMIVQNVGELIQEVKSALKTQECFDWSRDRGDEPTKYTVHEEHDEDTAQVPDVMFRDSSLSLGDTLSLVPRKALNIGFSKEGFKYQPEPETRSTGLALTTHSAISTKEPLPQQSLPSDGTRVGDPRLSKRLDIQPPQEAPPAAPGSRSPAGSSSSSSESKDETPEHTMKPAKDVTDYFSPRRTLNISFNNSASTTDEVERKTGAEDRWDQPRLGKVKALSERTQRDTEESSTDMNVSFSQVRELNINFDASDSSTDEVGRSTGADNINPTEEISPSPQLSLYKTSRFFSTPTDEARPRGEYSLHRKRLVVDIQPPLALPDAPATPPPSPEGEEAAGSGWRSREQQMRAMDGFGCNSMTQGDRSYMGLVVAKPFGISRPYQSVTSEITTTRGSEVSTSGALNMTYSLHFETHKEGSEA
uniref:Ig-like domain-containing protein n=1 Tax=Hucho hucho TaxID=62062 RepID=A0A4W5PSD3_9TELE